MEIEIRIATIADVDQLAKIDKRDESYLLFSIYLKDRRKVVHIMEHENGEEAYSMYEVMHPGNLALVHYNGNLKGKDAMDAMRLTSSLYFNDYDNIEYLLSISKKVNKRLRMLGRKLENLRTLGEVDMGTGDDGDNEMYYTLHRGI